MKLCYFTWGLLKSFNETCKCFNGTLTVFSGILKIIPKPHIWGVTFDNFFFFFFQNQLELSSKHQIALIDADLTNPNALREAIVAAKELQAVMNAEIHPALVQLSAVQEQKKRFDKWKSKFSHILSRHLNNLFIHIVSFCRLFLRPVHQYAIKLYSPWIYLLRETIQAS